MTSLKKEVERIRGISDVVSVALRFMPFESFSIRVGKILL